MIFTTCEQLPYLQLFDFHHLIISGRAEEFSMIGCLVSFLISPTLFEKGNTAGGKIAWKTKNINIDFLPIVVHIFPVILVGRISCFNFEEYFL